MLSGLLVSSPLHFGSVLGIPQNPDFPSITWVLVAALGWQPHPAAWALANGIPELRALKARGDRIFVTSWDLPILQLCANDLSKTNRETRVPILYEVQLVVLGESSGTSQPL